MNPRMAAFAVCLTLALAVTSGSLNAAANDYREEPTVGEMFADAVVVRPMTLLASAVGLAAWVVTLPFSLPGGSAGDAGEAWVLEPLGYTFARPLGEMRSER